jgi:hypothetical protein
MIRGLQPSLSFVWVRREEGRFPDFFFFHVVLVLAGGECDGTEFPAG